MQQNISYKWNNKSRNVNECLNKLTRSCYSKNTTEWYETNEITFVPRDINPPYFSELRPIDKYWTNLEKTKRVCTNAKDFEVKSKRDAHAMDVVKTLMKNIKQKVCLFANGNY